MVLSSSFGGVFGRHLVVPLVEIGAFGCCLVVAWLRLWLSFGGTYVVVWWCFGSYFGGAFGRSLVEAFGRRLLVLRSSWMVLLIVVWWCFDRCLVLFGGTFVVAWWSF
ncbi:hypothetical protein C2G38_2230420 [Gigaspora rosea]|uniref:Transmembrane protein n=1 Tax=Gigaspora rosea TaxID=44941 RepID=A0A397TU86_9GLOM|nr:hypothetical protein C2G38_2230420 [Gigaspora rosea]